MKNCSHGDDFKRYLTAKPGIFLFFLDFRVGIYASEILDTPLLLNYTMSCHGV